MFKIEYLQQLPDQQNGTFITTENFKYPYV